MYNYFFMNGYLWKIVKVDPFNPMLMDRTGRKTVATTDPNTRTVYLSSELIGDFLIKVLIHELGHCTMISFGLLKDIHRMVYPEKWIEAEEWVCNFIADYGLMIFSIIRQYAGDDAIFYIPYELEKLIS